MIVKKLVQKTKCKDYDNKDKVFHHVIWNFYIGYYLFGFIPLYKILVNREEELNYPELKEEGREYEPYKFTPHVYKKYKDLLIKG